MKLAHLYFDVNMSKGHKGLKALQRKQLGGDECAIFINRSRTALKMLTPSNVILHLKQPAHRPIDPETIRFLPNCVEGGELKYDVALKSVLARKFAATARVLK